ncbi:MAG: hypothetical protein JWN04_606 [Myxococcaceae bacterium]|nr:hypothetical protein [Myxococcaceae bacterium]
MMTYARAKFATAALFCLSACSDSGSDALDAGMGIQQDASARQLDAGASFAMDAAAMSNDSQARACEVAPDCLAVRTFAINLDPCCGDGLGCGLEYAGGALSRDSFYATLHMDVGACIPESTLFFTGKTAQSERVLLGDGGQLLVSDECPTAFITSMPFRGCCLPSNECAVTTHAIRAELGVLAGDASVPFAQIECLEPGELNAQLRASSLAGFAHLPKSTASCDYAALDSKLPRPSP